MKVHIKCFGFSMQYPCGTNGPARTVRHYLLTAENGLIDTLDEVDEPLVPEGDYELPDDQWDFSKGEVVEDEQDLLGSAIA